MVMASTGRVVDDSSKYETWESAIKGKVYVKRMDHTGKMIDELVRAGQTLHITPEERRLNSERAADQEYDPFANGFLTPVRLIEQAEDVEAISSNPNHMTEERMKELIQNRKAHVKLQEALEGISNQITLQRFVEVAKEQDATIKQIERIQARLAEISPQVGPTEVETVGKVTMTHAPESPRP